MLRVGSSILSWGPGGVRSKAVCVFERSDELVARDRPGGAARRPSYGVLRLGLEGHLEYLFREREVTLGPARAYQDKAQGREVSRIWFSNVYQCPTHGCTKKSKGFNGTSGLYRHVNGGTCDVHSETIRGAGGLGDLLRKAKQRKYAGGIRARN